MEKDEFALDMLSQGELCDEFEHVLRKVAGGQSFVLTTDGIPVAKVVPLPKEPGLSITRPARRMCSWTRLAVDRKTPGQPLSATLDELGGDRL